jgi:hypothetical protein
MNFTLQVSLDSLFGVIDGLNGSTNQANLDL